MKPTTQAPKGLGTVAPALEMDDAHEPGSDVGTLGDEKTGSSSDSAELADLRKRLVKLQAELALQGVELHELKSGGLLAVGSGVRAHFGELAAAEAWLRQRTAEAGAGARLDALRVRLQAAGWILSAAGAEGFTVNRWGQSRHLPDVAAIEAFARQIGVRS